MTQIIGICGGIGSGKSVVSRMLRCSGYVVFDCDSEAKKIMEENSEIKMRIRDEISSEVTDGASPIDRSKLASIIFADEERRQRLNAIVHGAVLQEVQRRAAAGDITGQTLFVEAAVMAESGLAALCDGIWQIAADTEERISRVKERDGSSRSDVESRMMAQHREEMMLEKYQYKINIIHNDDSCSLMRQIQELLKNIKTNIL